MREFTDFYFWLKLGLFLAVVPVLIGVTWRLFKIPAGSRKHPRGARFADAGLLTFLILFMLILSIAMTGITNVPALRWVYGVNPRFILDIWLAYAVTAAAVLVAAVYIIRARRPVGILFFTLACALFLGPVSALTAVTFQGPPKAENYVWAVNTLPGATIELDGKPPAYPADLPPLPDTLTRRLHEIHPIPMTSLRPILPASPTAPLDAVTTETGHLFTLHASGQKLMVVNDSLTSAGNWGSFIHIRPTPEEFNRRLQPLLAWIITHPQSANSTDIGPIINKAGSELFLYDQLTRLDAKTAAPFLAALHAKAFMEPAFGVPAPSVDANPYAALTQIVKRQTDALPSYIINPRDQQRPTFLDLIQGNTPQTNRADPLDIFEHVRTPAYTGADAFFELLPRLDPSQLKRLLQDNPTPYNNFYNFLPGGEPYENLVFWINANKDPARLKTLQDTFSNWLISGRHRVALSTLGGPTAAEYFQQAITDDAKLHDHPSYRRPLAEYATILGAAMPGHEGRDFRRNHAKQILQILTRYRSIDGSYDYVPNEWFFRALGPAANPDGSDASEPVRDLYLEWFLNQYQPSNFELQAQRFDPQLALDLMRAARDTGTFSSETSRKLNIPQLLAFRLNELIRVMRETRLSPYLDTLADKKCQIPGQTWEFLQQTINNAFAPPIHDYTFFFPQNSLYDNSQYAKRQQLQALRAKVISDSIRITLLTQIHAAVSKDPARYGLAISDPLKLHLKAPNHKPTAQEQNTAFLTDLLADNSLDTSAKSEKLHFAISTGTFFPGSLPTLLARPEPYIKKAAIDLILRWPTPENLTLLSTLASDSDPAISAKAKSAEAFITRLKSTPVDKLPDPFSDQACTFFDLPRPTP
jgi:hypothetical protein